MGAHMIPTFHARSVWGCWRIARRHTEIYQRMLSRAKRPEEKELCKAARDASDRIAKEIRYGKDRRPEPNRRRKDGR